MTSQDAYNKMIELAKELASEGKATKNFECSKALNDLVRLVLLADGDCSKNYHSEWAE